MITFESVTKTYLDKKILDDVSFSIDTGEFVFLVGNSGSGKTTIIKLLIKDEQPTSGKVFFEDIDLTKIRGGRVAQLRRNISVIFQDFKLLPHKNIFENIAFVMEVSGKSQAEIHDTVPYALDLVNLGDKTEHFPDQLSGGEKQKVAIARALAGNPKVIIADEPTGNLDETSSNEIVEILDKINQAGTTVIMATHNQDIVRTMKKRVLKIDNGRIQDIPAGEQPVEKKIKKAEPSKPKPPEKKELHPLPNIVEGKGDFESHLLEELNEEAIETEHTTANDLEELKSKKDNSEKKEDIKPELKISFTTKRKAPSGLSKSKDENSIGELQISEKTKTFLTSNNILSLRDLIELDDKKILALPGARKIDLKEIHKALKNLSS